MQKGRGNWKCCYCGQICESRNKLVEHKHENHAEQSHKAWNKGLTKETNQIIKLRALHLKKRYKDGELIAHNKGKKIWDEENRKRISQHRKQYLNQHPEKVPYLLNHSSKMSYPERYFKYVFNKENINLSYHLQVGRYQLDFYNEDLKKYVQIDGQSHYVDKKTIKIDEDRTQYLKELGWEGIRVRWKDYRNMTLDNRKQVVSNIKNFIK